MIRQQCDEAVLDHIFVTFSVKVAQLLDGVGQLINQCRDALPGIVMDRSPFEVDIRIVLYRTQSTVQASVKG